MQKILATLFALVCIAASPLAAQNTRLFRLFTMLPTPQQALLVYG
jgi:hypothetical protein